MAVSYIRVKAESNLGTTPSRSFGNLAILGQATAWPDDGKPFRLFTQPPAEPPADVTPPPAGSFAGPLADSVRLAFQQDPRPSLVYGVPVPETGSPPTPDWDAGLAVVSELDVQFVVMADLPLGGANRPVLEKLANHVKAISDVGDGRERMGVVMLPGGVPDAATFAMVAAGALKSERMIYVAHKSTQDAAAAVAGTVAGYEPSVSVLLKPVSIRSDPFTPEEIVTINGDEIFGSGPKGKGVNWLTRVALFQDQTVRLGEAYTGNTDATVGKQFIDIVRTLDDVSFRLKARLIRSLGRLRISRVGLRALQGEMEGVLIPLVRGEVIDDFVITLPLLTILDKDESSLTGEERTLVANARSDRLVPVVVTVVYAGAIHRLDIKLQFSALPAA